jgi:hypothetical protein
MNTTDQVPNPTGKGGFGDHPENRNPGGWKKEDTPRFKLEKMMNMSYKQLQEIAVDEDAALFERKLAKCIADGDWKTIREMIAEVYGTPKSSVDLTSGGKELKQTLVQFIDGTTNNTDSN